MGNARRHRFRLPLMTRVSDGRKFLELPPRRRARNPESRRSLGFRIRGTRRRDSARATRYARRGFGRPSFPRCATRGGRDAIDDRCKSRRNGAEKRSSSSLKGSFTNRSSSLTRSRSPRTRTAGRRSRSTSPRRLDGKRSFVLGVDARAPDDHDARPLQPIARGQTGMVRRSRRHLEAGAARGARRLHLDRLAVATSYDLAAGDCRGQGQAVGGRARDADPRSCARRRRNFTRNFRARGARVRQRRSLLRRPIPGRRKRRTFIASRSSSFATARSSTRSNARSASASSRQKTVGSFSTAGRSICWAPSIRTGILKRNAGRRARNSSNSVSATPS